MPEHTGQLYSFTETCGFSDEIYFKLPKHFWVALMPGQSRDCVGLQFTNKSSFANMKITLTKELCPVHYNQGVSSCCNPSSPGHLNTSQGPLEHLDQTCFSCREMSLAPYIFQSQLGNGYLFVWVFRSRCSVLTNLQRHHLKSGTEAGKIHSSPFIVK